MKLIINFNLAKRFFTSCLLILHFSLLITNCFSQWQQIATINTTELRSVKFLNEFTGIACGNGGIWRSTNSGVNWLQVLSGSNLNSVSFYNMDDGMAVGDSGKIFKTTDNGITWQQLSSGTINNLNSIATSNPTIDIATYFAYIVGQNGIFLRSFNSGSTWSIGSAYTQDLYYIWIMNPGTGTGFTTGASNSETYFVTANGGTYWQPILNTTNGGYHLFSGAYIQGQNTCVCVGSSGRIRRTTNWGLTWQLPVSNTTYDLYGVQFADSSAGWLCGQNGFIERSTNKGLNWLQQYSPVINHLRAMSFINNQTGWIVGNSGIVLKTTNGGILGTIVKNSEVPKEFKLYQNYPNPFNPTTIIRYDLNKSGWVKLRIYDIKGCLIEELVNEYETQGEYYAEFEGSKYASGVYLCKIEMGRNVSIKLMNLIK